MQTSMEASNDQLELAIEMASARYLAHNPSFENKNNDKKKDN